MVLFIVGGGGRGEVAASVQASEGQALYRQVQYESRGLIVLVEKVECEVELGGTEQQLIAEALSDGVNRLLERISNAKEG